MITEITTLCCNPRAALGNRLNDYQTRRKGPNKRIWIELKHTGQYQAGLHEHYETERKFGEAKQSHGLRSCRYVGLLRCGCKRNSPLPTSNNAPSPLGRGVITNHPPCPSPSPCWRPDRGARKP